MKRFLVLAILIVIIIYVVGLITNRKKTEVSLEDKSSYQSIGGSTGTDVPVSTVPAYEQFSVVFKGNPSVEKIQLLMDAILDQYSLEHTEINKQKIGSALVAMSQKSPIGTTEMQILKYMYQNPDLVDTPPVAIAKASVILDKTN